MTTLRALAFGLVLLTAGLAPVVGGATPACAASTGPHAGLVVDDGAHVRTFCVALDAPAVTGLHLIELASDQYGLSYSFGLGGLAVCRLNGVGPSGDDCFADYPDYWGYWHGDGHGGWTWGSSGAGETSIGNGDVDGWSYGSGDGATTHAEPRAGSSTVCTTPTPSPSPRAGTTSPTTAPTHAPSPAVVASTKASTTSDPSTARVTPSAAPSATHVKDRSTHTADIRPVSAQPPADGGSPVPLLAAVALTLLLGIGGWLRLRGRGKDPV